MSDNKNKSHCDDDRNEDKMTDAEEAKFSEMMASGGLSQGMSIMTCNEARRVTIAHVRRLLQENR